MLSNNVQGFIDLVDNHETDLDVLAAYLKLLRESRVPGDFTMAFEELVSRDQIRLAVILAARFGFSLDFLEQRRKKVVKI